LFNQNLFKMKRLLTLLLVFCFAVSVSAVTHVPESKAEKFLIEKSIVKADLVSVNVVTAEIAVIVQRKVFEKNLLCLHRFKDESGFIDTNTKFISSNYPSNHTFYSKLPDKDNQG
jgi:hypothetical protein